MPGKFWYALAKYAGQNQNIYDYLEMIHEENLISPGVVATGFVNQNINFENPFIQRIILVEFFFPVMIYQQWKQQN